MLTKYLKESYKSLKSRQVEKIELLNDLLITLSRSSLDDAYPLDPPLMLYQSNCFEHAKGHSSLWILSDSHSCFVIKNAEK